MRTLLLLRHAHAAKGTDDRARPLSGRGRREAREIGAHLRGAGPAPDRILVSSARRSIETAERLELDAPLGETPGIYEAGALGLLELLGGETADRLMAVGHNPAVSMAAARLAEEGDAPSLSRLAAGLPPGGLAVLSLRIGDWSELARARGALLRLFLPGRPEGA